MAGPLTPRDQAMAYLGVLSRASSEGLSAAQAMQAVAAEARNRGYPLTFDVATEAARLYGSTAGLAHAASNLNAAPGSNAIEGSYLARLPYGEGRVGPGAQRVFDVRVYYQATPPSPTGEDYVTLRYYGGLPTTVGQLRDQARNAARLIVGTYGRDFVDIGDLSIGEL